MWCKNICSASFVSVFFFFFNMLGICNTWWLWFLLYLSSLVSKFGKVCWWPEKKQLLYETGPLSQEIYSTGLFYKQTRIRIGMFYKPTRITVRPVFWILVSVQTNGVVLFRCKYSRLRRKRPSLSLRGFCSSSSSSSSVSFWVPFKYLTPAAENTQFSVSTMNRFSIRLS